MSQSFEMNGFTLLEILISLFVLSIIGAIITTGLNMVVKTQVQVKKKYNDLAEVQLALSIFERDLQQITDRPILNEDGAIQPALEISENRIEFTCAGYSNPFSMNKRSTLQRVAYSLEDHKLIRTSWSSLDRVSDSIADHQILLYPVEYFYIHLITSPSSTEFSTGNKSKNLGVNKGISIEMNLIGFGYVKRIIAIPTNTFEISYAATA